MEAALREILAIQGQIMPASWVREIAFGTTSEVLAKHQKGEMIAISGKLTKSSWTGRDGVERSGFSVLVDTIASARTVRPGKRGAPARGGVPFDDELRF